MKEKKTKKTSKKYTNDDLAYTLQMAAEFLENEEWPENDGGAQVAAYKEAAKRIRRMEKRVPLK